METIPIHKAKSTLSQLVKRALAGETIYIGGYGKAEVMLVSLDGAGAAKLQKRREFMGCMKGQISMAEDFDAPLPGDVLESLGYTDKETQAQ
jgi:antitoxin (DNA-binding transcriptional repressor) of toxin-antitoxin stability system